MRTIKNHQWLITALLCLTMAMSVAMPALAVGLRENLGMDNANFGVLGGDETPDIQQTIEDVVQWALTLLGIIAVIIIMYGGWTWMTAAGDDAKVKKAKQIIISGVIGLIIILLSYLIINTIVVTIDNSNFYK